MPQTAPLIPAWTPYQKADFGKEPIRLEHRLDETGVFDDGELAALLDAYPAELFDINLFDIDEEGRLTLRTGSRGRLPGDVVLEGIKQGRVWVQLRAAETHSPKIGALVREAFEQISAQAPGFKPVSLNAQLILSGPQAQVAYHCDAPGVILFHLRGRKRIWIYPAEEEFVSQAAIEDIMLKQTTEDLPYHREMDAHAVTIDLEPGEAAAWPLHAPHRVQNLEGFNVSLSVDYQTWNTRLTNAAHYANGILRRRGVPVAAMARTPAPARAALWAASLAMRRVRLVEDRIRGLERSFELTGAA